MPYASNDDLPRPVRHVLPPHAQDIWRAAFNHAWAAPRTAADEAACARIAWSAVKRTYRKDGDAWVRR
ncbi:MAG: ChaB family protein [Acetobacteraceae bacterium]|jgi:cation transport regulator|nr:ChaB family protein [Acetobacteraceae bacterium]